MTPPRPRALGARLACRRARSARIGQARHIALCITHGEHSSAGAHPAAPRRASSCAWGTRFAPGWWSAAIALVVQGCGERCPQRVTVSESKSVRPGWGMVRLANGLTGSSVFQSNMLYRPTE
jgi:hypothetical protein